MKIIQFVIIAIMASACSENPAKNDATNGSWNVQKREQHLKNRNDSTTWNTEMLSLDKQFLGIRDFGPFEVGAFPVPNYELLGKNSFKGIGNIGDEFIFDDKNIIMNSFFTRSNKLNKSRLNNLPDEIFFQILVSTDTLDHVNYNLTNSITISRNHPDYLGQGFVQTKKNRVEYTAFQTAEGDAFAIVNARLFNLRFGKTILISPQVDGTLQSMQIKSLQIQSDSIVSYTTELLNDKKVNAFFKKNNAI